VGPPYLTRGLRVDIFFIAEPRLGSQRNVTFILAALDARALNRLNHARGVRVKLLYN